MQEPHQVSKLVVGLMAADGQFLAAPAASSSAVKPAVATATSIATPPVSGQPLLDELDPISKKMGSKEAGNSASNKDNWSHASPVGFSGGYDGRVSGINVSEDDLSHPPGFSKQCYSFMGDNHFVSEGHQKSNSCFIELKKTIDMGTSLGYNMEGCLDRVKDVLQGHVERQHL